MSDLSQKLHKYKNKLIALYGLGTETKKALNELSDNFRIAGLLDSYRVDGMMYGKPIISIQQAVKSGVELILVVARPGSCKAIVKKIVNICIDNQIDLIDIRGKNLCDIKKVAYGFRESDGITKKQLLKLVKENEVISVDLFDTLVMRQTLFSTDIFEIVDNKLRKEGIFINDFCGKRLESEKYLAKHMAPGLADIYQYMKDTYVIPDVVPRDLAEMEWRTDYEMLIPRQEMCEFVKEIFEQGKEVYIVSDTYYSKNQLVKILEKCGITFYTDIFASCEYNTSKTQRLFAKLKEKTVSRKCMHIGDDIVADVESAKKSDIRACQIYSGIELLEMVGYLGLWDSIDCLSDRIKIGMFVARLFNSPFQFENAERMISVANSYDIGYLFFAPMISDFVIWFKEQVSLEALPNIWFCARDGYLIKKLYDELENKDESVYFLTSRIAAIRAGMKDERDIRYVAEMKFSGTLQEQLQERFGITMQNDRMEDEGKDTLIDYAQEILSKACTNRKNYETYIESLSVKEGAIAFFDFVAKGTSQMYIGRLIENHLKGFYFLQLEEEHMRDKCLDIQPFYTADEMENSAIFDNYYILETMLTAPSPSVAGFDEDGKVYYAEETRKEEDIECFKVAQNGIFDYFKTYQCLCPKEEERVNKKLDEVILALIHNIYISDKTFLNLKVEDPFFHRNTDMTDLI